MNQLFNLIALILCSFLIINVAGDTCSANNCQRAYKCDGFVRDNTCPRRGDTCCQLVKDEYRTKCDQSLGACTKSNCPPSIRVAREKSLDCAADENCCVLVI
ncbi:uncharacterized protein LOC122856676 [Aphidius gifuensis]|uniref:uncharacterized protein LOC122856676 n=1 Tax=Aphidius gifuensis TaxID=684658 RepID=UPI001CDD23B4|nr:uncharacterized protein LOC122856676 [Aphidius gifuensis]